MQAGLKTIIEKYNRQKIVVIGDMVADVYLNGRISRISREAPVLVLEYERERIVPGGAANVAHNLASLGGQVWAAGFLGSDSAGEGLAAMLAAKGVHVEGLLADPARSTITKTRVVAGGAATVSQQIVRIDRETKAAVPPALESDLAARAGRWLPEADGVVLSDYGSGSVTPALRRQVIEGCRAREIPCIVDSRYDILRFAGVGFVKQNEAEAAAAAGFPITDEASLLAAGRFLLEKLRARGVLLTRGGDGMSLFEADGAVHHVPVTNKSEVYDVSGAGDTAVAAFILAAAAGASPLEAVRLANFAAGVAVRKLGTAAVAQHELCQVVGRDAG